MSISFSGMDSKLESTKMEIHVPLTNQFIQLANALEWRSIQSIVIEDIKKTTNKLKWWLGRKLEIRIHLAVFILQLILKTTDREMERAIKYNALYQVFCGKTIVEKWHCPDHTKIEEFRNRISPETSQKIVSYVANLAVKNGFADPSKMDVDSTVQEANMAYPSDAHLLVKLAMMAKKVINYLQKKRTKISDLTEGIYVDVKAVKKIAKDYFFMAKNVSKEVKQKAFKKLYQAVEKEVTSVIGICASVKEDISKKLPWYIRRTVKQIQEHAKKYLEDVYYFIENQTMKTGKILSFHLKDVACIMKGKLGKTMEFGRIFQLGRIAGNFFIALPSSEVRQEDRASILLMVEEHENIFGEGILKSLGTDKGYYSKENKINLQKKIEELGIQIPCNVREQHIIDQKLKDRRAGIEPLIGHIKDFGLRKSKMKSDKATLSSGYRSILGFNLHQFMRYLTNPKLKLSTQY
mgnify:CR=1 FL=1